jgi:hypothetical protein
MATPRGVQADRRTAEKTAAGNDMSGLFLGANAACTATRLPPIHDVKSRRSIGHLALALRWCCSPVVPIKSQKVDLDATNGIPYV